MQQFHAGGQNAELSNLVRGVVLTPGISDDARSRALLHIVTDYPVDLLVRELVALIGEQSRWIGARTQPFTPWPPEV